MSTLPPVASSTAATIFARTKLRNQSVCTIDDAGDHDEQNEPSERAADDQCDLASAAHWNASWFELHCGGAARLFQPGVHLLIDVAAGRRRDAPAGSRSAVCSTACGHVSRNAGR